MYKYMYRELVEWQWQEKTEVLKEKPVPVPLSRITKPMWSVLVSIPGSNGKMPTTNYMSYDTAQWQFTKSDTISIICDNKIWK